MNILKHSIFSTAFVTSLATSSVASNASFSGFYLGAQMGYGSGTLEAESQNKKYGGKLGLSGLSGGLHAGYGYHFPNGLYLGGEGYLNAYDQHQKSKLNSIIACSIKKKHAFGFKVRPGFVSGNALFYGVIGYESARFKFKSESGYTLKKENYDERYNAFVPGVGVAFHASDEIIVGLEATHAIYAKKDNVSVRNTDAFLRLSYKL